MKSDFDPSHFSDDLPEEFEAKLDRLETRIDDLELLLLNIKEKLGYINFILGAWTIGGTLLVAKFAFGKPFPWE